MDERYSTPALPGVGSGTPPDPCTVVIFGASGDLTRRELIPALFELGGQGLLPEPFAIVGFARSKWNDEEFRQRMQKAVEAECTFDKDRWDGFRRCLYYVPGDFGGSADRDYAHLRAKLDGLAAEKGQTGNVLFHLATPPSFFGTIVQRLQAAGLATDESGWRRLVIEKPFGVDRTSARALDREILSVFGEDRVYRIDHFLGKETVQNMLVVRFANPSFEPIWNRDYVDHVQITVAEDIGIGTRAGFYEQTGIVRDMVQNHLLQLLCMAAIEPPGQFNGAALRDETVKVLRAIRPVDVAHDCVRGQYGPGHVDGKKARGYREEDNVDDHSSTPTFAAVKLMIDNWRWAGVPWYLRTGKRLPRKLTEVAMHFRQTPHMMFPSEQRNPQRHVMAFRLQPEEGIIQTFSAKQPGPRLCISPVTMAFQYATAFGVTELPRAYAWLLLDVMEGDQTLFARADWISEAWRIIDPIVAAWEAEAPSDFPNYAAGTWGPEDADRLLTSTGREWRII